MIITVESLDKKIFYLLCLYAVTFMTVQISNVVLGLAIALFLLRYYKKNDDIKRTLCSINKNVWMVLALFVVTACLSAVFSDYFADGIKKFSNAYLYRPLPAIIILSIISDKKKLITLISLALLSMLVMNVATLFEFVREYPNNFREAILMHPVRYAGLLSATIPVLVVLFFTSNRYRKLIAIALAISLATLVVNGSRGGWIAVFVSGIFVMLQMIKYNKRNLAIICAASLAIASVFYINPNLNHRISTITDVKYQSNSERMLMWKSTINMCKDHPLLGIGIGSYSHEYPKYMSPLAKERTNVIHAHNNFFQILGEQGILGIIGFIAFTLLFFVISFREWKKKRDPVSLMMFASWMGITIQGLTEYSFGMAITAKFYWFIIGLYLSWTVVTEDRKRCKSREIVC